jgi:hypothetical protein
LDGFRRVAGAALLAFLVTSCGSPAAEPADRVTRSVTASPSAAEPSESTSTAPSRQPSESASSNPPTVVDDQTVAFPTELVGTWQSVDQGSAEDLIEIHADGSYLRAMLLMQQRPSGVFSFSIGMTGQVVVEGSTLRLVPTSGTESMSDPDAPSDSYTDRPLEELTPDVYQWSVSGGSLWLDGQYGLVEFRPAGP